MVMTEVLFSTQVRHKGIPTNLKNLDTGTVSATSDISLFVLGFFLNSFLEVGENIRCCLL